MESNDHEEHHGHDHINKSQHNLLVAAWIVKTFGQEPLRNGGVIDIGGGRFATEPSLIFCHNFAVVDYRGIISYELSVRYGVESTLIEPRYAAVGNVLDLNSVMRRKMKKLTRHRENGSVSKDNSPLMQLLREHDNTTVDDDCKILERVRACLTGTERLPFNHIVTPFPLHLEDVLSNGPLLQTLSSATLLVGVHPDQVTGCIVDTAVHLGIPFVVVPCCVFANEFSTRRKRCGGPVRTYNDLVQFLQEKHPNIRVAELPFVGRNTIIYCTSYNSENTVHSGHVPFDDDTDQVMQWKKARVTTSESV